MYLLILWSLLNKTSLGQFALVKPFNVNARLPLNQSANRVPLRVPVQPIPARLMPLSAANSTDRNNSANAYGPLNPIDDDESERHTSPSIVHSMIWETALEQANVLLKEIESAEDQESLFTDFSDLARWGWETIRDGVRSSESSLASVDWVSSLFRPLAALNISLEQPLQVRWIAKHSKAFRVMDLTDSSSMEVSTHPAVPIRHVWRFLQVKDTLWL